MSKRTLILIAVLLGVTAILLAIALAPRKDKTTDQPQAGTTPEYATATLEIDSVPQPASDGTYTANIKISTGNSKVTGVQLEMSFDASRITDLEIDPGTFFTTSTEIIKKVDNLKGTVSYALAAGRDQDGISGNGVVAVLKFREIGNAGEFAQITFLPKTQISSADTDKSVMKTATGTTFRIESTSGASPSVNPTSGTAIPTVVVTQAPSPIQ